jgi:hypothetical protein
VFSLRRSLHVVLSRRTAAVTLLALTVVFGLGARCIQLTSVHVDKDGYTHITGEMANDTSVQGVHIMLRATLYDDQGNVVATKDAPTCPPDTQAHNQTMFDIRFDNPNVPPFARYDVRPISGQTLTAPLPDPDVVVLQTDAIRFVGIPPIPGLPITDKDVLLQFGVRNRSGQTIVGVQGCAAVYDQHGNVVAADTGELTELDENGFPRPAEFGSAAPASAFFIVRDVPAAPTQVRAWLWFGDKGAPTSAWQFFSTPMITIQTRKP